MKIGMCGIGRFSPHFVRLFKAHPLVEEVVVADLVPERVAAVAQEHQLRRTYGSLDDLLASDVDAVAIFTQRHLHGAQSIAALEADKDVYSAVPAAGSLDELGRLVQTVEKTGRIYMTGETSYYYPSTLYCRKRFAAGDFGRFAYAEAQYHHDMDHFYDAYKHSGGPDWKRVAGVPPMYYPTHTLSMILSVTGARATHVSCLGFNDEQHPDAIFGPGRNLWDNPFSNESALMRTSDGGVIRINEMRRIGWHGGNSVYMSFYGTEASFEETANSACWVTKDGRDMQDISELMRVSGRGFDEGRAKVRKWNPETEPFFGVSSVHPVERLPESFRGLGNGHFGSHQFLVDDFCRAVSQRSLPPCHVWSSAAWCAPGLVAHESALRDGQMMSIPDFGQPRS
jgi:predicted dehydrogenase